MLYNKRYFAIILILLLTGTTSCKKWFDLKPSDGIVNEDYWKTKEDVHAAVIGAYASLLGDPAGSDSRDLSEILFLWGELRADMLAPSTGTKAEDYEVMNMNTSPANTITDWKPLYRTINYCNTILRNAPEVMNLDKTLTQDVLNGYLAEAKSLRALLYFYLVRSFGDVPLKLEPTTSDDEIVTLPKSTQQEVLQQILADLNDAESKALLTYGAQASDKGRITRYTINAIQADVYLWMEQYNDAITACNKVINAKKFGLISGSTAWYNTLYYSGNSNESLFEFQFNKQKINNFLYMFYNVKRFVASTVVMDQVYSTESFNKDIRGDGASVRAADNLIWKYVGKNDKDVRATDEAYAHWFVYRYADILLLKAEALAQLKTETACTEALNLVYTIRQRANALPSTDNAPSAVDFDGVARFVLEEQAREQMYEGKRWYNLLRFAKRNNYAHLDVLLDLVSVTVPLNMMNSAKAKIRDYNSHYFPIYQYELQTNKSLVQNPFYK
ncbi:Starch-binding associating with outer membrane [Filimonas lacunae]|uniref:Starch-binding associating with outer membrane n=1 Tax=Filimonas lacunae TaxID=477680 RepID=A0A173MAJ3_9BACT|nr:RagB/SusD family nutrient uptake outer membrane protein [Filimonas lacunae]BAV04556.1 outer membrane protein, nutrient binding [Filimonas lacunae]SIT34763.1 Starch-binding associating with outer membrane [Filimonas lacunae]